MLKLKLQPPDVKIWLIGKDPDAGKDWEQEEKAMTEDELAGWHHRLNGHEFGQTPGVGDGQRGLACCNSWGLKELDTTEWLNWTEDYVIPLLKVFQWLLQYKIKTFCGLHLHDLVPVFLSILIWKHFLLDYCVLDTPASLLFLTCQVYSYIRAFSTSIFLSRIIFDKAVSLSFSSGSNTTFSKKKTSWLSYLNYLQSPTLIVSFWALITIWSHCMYLFNYCLFLPL